MTLMESLMQEIRDQLTEQLDLTYLLTDEQLRERIEQLVFMKAQAIPLTAREKVELVGAVWQRMRGLDVLDPLLADESVTEIMINDFDQIYVERSGKLELAEVTFDSREKLEDLIQTIVASVNRVVNEAQPIVDARLKDGSRIHVVLPPIALNGPTMTIRKFSKTPLKMGDLIACKMLSQEMAAYLEEAMKSHRNIFISGGTGSGKTTFLNALSTFIPPEERVITVEDAAELQLSTLPNVVSLETRNANTEGKGELTMRDLIKAALRMRPTRIMVGEVRGAEAADMLQALNTGHAGNSTGHAGSASEMIVRLEAMVQSGTSLSPDIIRKQLATAIDIIVHLQRLSCGRRCVAEISELRLEHDNIVLRPLFVHDGER